MAFETDSSVKDLEDFCRTRGADLFGVAELALADEFISSQARFPLDQYPRAISLGMRLCDPVVDQHTPEETPRESQYWHHVYDVVTPALNFLAYDVARWLGDRRYRAWPIPASTPYDFGRLEGVISHKLTAHLSGLGWIGKSCLLLTDLYGPRVRFVSILTDAPFETGSLTDKPCGKCRVCVDTCPVGAFSGAEFRASESREARFDAFKCSDYRRNHACGLCVSSCPAGRGRRRSVGKG